MMLQVNHRESHIFLPDAQFLPFLDPKLHDFAFEIRPSDYRGDGSGFLKLAFDRIGEIDFIVGQALTAHSVTEQMVEGEQVNLETAAEIITKKVHYRGASVKPRDIFDIAAAARSGRRTGCWDGRPNHTSSCSHVVSWPHAGKQGRSARLTISHPADFGF